MQPDRGQRRSIPVLIGRALRLRCPHCGRGRLFDGWFRLRPACPVCGFRTQRGEEGEGYFLGAMTFNLVASEFLFVASLALAILVTWPAPPWNLIWIGSVLGIVLAPFLFYPFSWTLWLALDLLLRPADRDRPL